MTPQALIFTSLLLGVFVMLAGAYGLLYSLGVARGAHHLATAGYACWAAQCVVVAAIVRFTPLDLGWKIFIVVSCIAYFEIPPVTWRYLRSIHGAAGGR